MHSWSAFAVVYNNNVSSSHSHTHSIHSVRPALTIRPTAGRVPVFGCVADNKTNMLRCGTRQLSARCRIAERVSIMPNGRTEHIGKQSERGGLMPSAVKCDKKDPLEHCERTYRILYHTCAGSHVGACVSGCVCPSLLMLMIK